MNYPKIGAKLRVARLRLGLRQSDVAAAARVRAQSVSRAERGQLDGLTLRTLERLAAVLGAWLSVDVRSRSCDLDRLVNARHAALAEEVVAWLAAQPGWEVASEVSFAFGREIGVIDVLARHRPTGHIVVIELKTGIYDVNELLGTLDRKERLVARVASERGWAARAVSVWLIVADSSTNRRRVADHRSMIASKLPADGRSLRGWVRRPATPVHGVAFWSNRPARSASRETASRERVRRPSRTRAATDPRLPRPSQAPRDLGRAPGWRGDLDNQPHGTD